MASTSRNRWSRLVRMSRDEILTRVAQEVGKRLDLARFYLHPGYRPKISGKNRKPTGHFLFSAQELAARTALIQEHLSAEAAAIVRDANGILEHRFQLLGYEAVPYGEKINWHLDAVHGKCSPIKPWFKIRFLDFGEVGDHKIIWELNRHQHLVTLAKAWRFTGKDSYIQELLRHWYGWQTANPYPMGMNWSSSLEVAFRSLSWLWVRHLLADCDALPSGFDGDLLKALALHGRHIERHLSTYFSPNTHLLGEATALFFIGTLCPEIANAGHWRKRGWQILSEDSQKQVRRDGVYFEQSLYYHVYALDFFLYSRLLASKNGVDIPADFDAAIKKMLEVLAAISQVGLPAGFGDDDGGRVFDPRRNRAAHLTDPLAIGALIYGNAEFGTETRLTEESIWLFGEAAVSGVSMHDAGRIPESTAFEAGGLYIFASPDNPATQMMIDAGPQGTANSGHGHADALAVQVWLDRKPLLVDPGTFAYMTQERDAFRGTGAHNTLRVDFVDQAIPDGPFAWSCIPTIQAETWITGKSFTYFCGSHNGYARLSDPVIHRRFIFYLHGGPWLLRDFAEGKESHALEIFWHFAPNVTLTNQCGRFLATQTESSGESPGMELLPVEDHRWKHDIISGETSPAYGRKEWAAVLQSSARIKLPAEHAVMLIPSTDSESPQARFRGLEGGDPVAYRLDNGKSTRFFVFAQPAMGNWSAYGISSDARFVYFHIEDGHLTHFILCQGRWAQAAGESIFSHDNQVERFEWLVRGGVPQVYSSDPQATNSWSGNAHRLLHSLSLSV